MREGGQRGTDGGREGGRTGLREERVVGWLGGRDAISQSRKQEQLRMRGSLRCARTGRAAG